MNPQQPICPNCGRPMDGPTPNCPNCGVSLQAYGAWPPPPDGQIQPVAPSPQLLTGAVWGDVIVGIIATIGLYVLWCTGLITVPLLYSFQRRKYPIFARALGWAYIASLVGLGGAFLACVGAFNKS